MVVIPSTIISLENWFSSGGDFAPHGTFSIVSRHWMESRDAAIHPTIHRNLLLQRIIPPKRLTLMLDKTLAES